MPGLDIQTFIPFSYLHLKTIVHSCPEYIQRSLSSVVSYPSSLSHPWAYSNVSKADLAIVLVLARWQVSTWIGFLFFQMTLQFQQNSVLHFGQRKWVHPPFRSILLPQPTLGHFFVVLAIVAFVPASFSRAFRWASLVSRADLIKAWKADWRSLLLLICFCLSILRKCSQMSSASSLQI